MIIGIQDFERAMKWLVEAEYFMPNLFVAGATGADGKAMEEILHYVKVNKTVPEANLYKYAMSIGVISQSVERLIKVMEMSNTIKRIGYHPKYSTPIYGPGDE